MTCKFNALKLFDYGWSFILRTDEVQDYFTHILLPQITNGPHYFHLAKRSNITLRMYASSNKSKETSN